MLLSRVLQFLLWDKLTTTVRLDEIWCFITTAIVINKAGKGPATTEKPCSLVLLLHHNWAVFLPGHELIEGGFRRWGVPGVSIQGHQFLVQVVEIDCRLNPLYQLASTLAMHFNAIFVKVSTVYIFLGHREVFSRDSTLLNILAEALQFVNKV